MSTGLVLGKFAPLHAGHQLLIETAREETDHTVVLIYDAPSTTTIPLRLRAGWIGALYPDVEIIEAWDGPEQVGATPAIERAQEDYLCAVLGQRRITHFYSSESYGEHVSRALGAVDRRIDPARNAVPVSGTAIRADAYKHRRYLDPLVYRDLIARVVFLGAPSTGKTTLARMLAERHDTVWMPEYGRDYWLAHQQDRRLTPAQLVEIAAGHLEREDALMAAANRFLFVDTEAITTYVFALDYHGQAAPRLAQLALEAEKRYDLFFLCADDIPYENTWERSGEVHRRNFQKWIRAELTRRRIAFVTLEGNLETRLDRAERVLTGFDRFAPLGDLLLSR